MTPLGKLRLGISLAGGAAVWMLVQSGEWIGAAIVAALALAWIAVLTDGP